MSTSMLKSPEAATEPTEDKIVLKFAHVNTMQTIEGVCRIIETILLQKGAVDIKAAVPARFSAEKAAATTEKVEQINNFLDELSRGNESA